MGEYILRSDFATIVAMDQHARSVALCALDLSTGERRTGRLCGCPSAADIARWASWATAPVRFAYESGPCGFQLARDMAALGYRCDVIAVSSIPRSAKDRAFKDDRRDASALLEALLSPNTRCRRVFLPSEECEAARDLVRAHFDALDAERRAKQRLQAMLLRHGHVWDERTASGKLRQAWTKDYIRWISSIELGEGASQKTLRLYLEAVLEGAGRVRETRRACLELAEGETFKPYVDALTRLKGVDALVALAYTASVDDFSRFRNGRSVSAYFGLTPKRHDSGERTGGGGAVSKAGDATVRRAVIEGISGISCFTAQKKAVREGHEVSAAVEAEALRANQRNRERYQDLIGKGKRPNVAKVAVASELVRQMWVIGRIVDGELGR